MLSLVCLRSRFNPGVEDSTVNVVPSEVDDKVEPDANDVRSE